MKTILSFAMCLALLTHWSAIAQDTEGRLEITVDYERQDGRGSNQYGVWIEDSRGNLVRTLYVSAFTGKGGFEPRPDCIPVWVEKSGVRGMSETQVDAFTGATPQTGKQTYIWDGKDASGNKAPAGTYAFVVEATYLGANRVMFKGEFTAGKKEQEIASDPVFNSEEQKNRNMIKSVKARYIPK